MLIDPSEAQIAEAIERNQISAFREFSKVPGVDFREEADHTRLFSGIPLTFFNQVYDASFAGDDADERIDSIIEFFAARAVPFMWVTGGTTRPADLEARLEKRGFEIDRLPGMAVEIERLEDAPPPKELTIRRADTPELLAVFSDAVAEGFGASERETVARAWIDFFGALDPMACTRYVGYVDDVPVCTSMSYRADGVVGLYAVATVAGARGRGYGSAMTVRPLLDALDEGYRIGILHASRMGLPVYERLGFRELCTVGMNAWKPAEMIGR